MSTLQTPLHDKAAVVGVTEACKYNDHSQCRNPRCACDCHRQQAQAAQVPAQVADPQVNKVCPSCNVKRPSFERFCRACGTKLGSLQCPACGAICDPEDHFCYGCGCPMSEGAREKAKAEGKAAPAILPSVHISQPIRVDQDSLAASEAEVLRAIQEANAAGAALPKVEAPADRVFSLPSGSFKISSDKPVAGRPRGMANVPVPENKGII